MIMQRDSANTLTVSEEACAELEKHIGTAITWHGNLMNYMDRHEVLDRAQVENFTGVMLYNCYQVQRMLEEMQTPSKDCAEALFRRWLAVRDTIDWMVHKPGASDDLPDDLYVACQHLEQRLQDAPMENVRDFAAKILGISSMGAFDVNEWVVDQARALLALDDDNQSEAA